MTWKYVGSATKMVFGQPMHLGMHWLEDSDGFKHMASPVHKVAGKNKNGSYKFRIVGWDVGKYGILKPREVKGYKLRL